jgi:hypothetical protein
MDGISQKFSYRVSRKSVQWGAELIHSDGRTDIQQVIGAFRYSRFCFQKRWSIEMCVTEGHLPYLFILKRNGIFFLKIKDIEMRNHAKQHKIMGLKAYGTYCGVVPCVYHTYYKNGRVRRATKRKGVARASMSFQKTSTPQLPPHYPRELPTTLKQSVLLRKTVIRPGRSES